MAAARAIALVAKVSDDAHVAEAVAASREERVLDDLHANRTQKVLVRLRRRRRERVAGGCGGGAGVGGHGGLGRFRLDGGDERPRGELFHEVSYFSSFLLSRRCGCELVKVVFAAGLGF